MKLYQYPIQTEVNRIIPKNRFYQQGNASGHIERLFVEQVEKIRWANKLSQSSIHLQESEELKEIQIFQIESRVEDLDLAILAYIDKLVPSPIIFEILFQEKIRVAATYKRLNQNNKLKAIIGEYYQSEWLPENRHPLPLFLTLTDLYEHFISELLPFNHQTNTNNVYSLADKIALNQQIEQLTREIEKLRKKLKSEKQFNRKVEINLQIQALEKQLSNV